MRRYTVFTTGVDRGKRRSFSAKDVHDSLIVLANLESLAGRLACSHAPIEAIQEIHQRLAYSWQAPSVSRAITVSLHRETTQASIE